MWDRYEHESANAASQDMVSDLVCADDVKNLENLVKFKKWSPMAATIGALILLRARRWDKLHDWIRNLANWFPQFPDAAVLWTEQCLQQPNPIEQPFEALQYLLLLEHGPLPVFGETLGYAARQVHAFLALEGLPSNAKDKLQKIQLRLQHVLPWYRPGGLFATSAGPIGTFPSADEFQNP
jgi:hypothetical protein